LLMPLAIDRNNPFPLPKDMNTLLWRYMSLAKFTSLLQTNQLFLSRSDKLGDKFEGSLTRRHYKQTSMDGSSEAFRKGLREKAYVSCWHANEGESAAMWSLYGLSSGSVAVKTTYAQLMKVLPDMYVGSSKFYVGHVQYVDHEIADPVDVRNVISPFFHKHKSYSHEREFRVLFHAHGTSPSQIPSGADLPVGSSVSDGGLSVTICLRGLIESVVVSPGADPWFGMVVKGLLDKYCSGVALKPSELDVTPYF